MFILTFLTGKSYGRFAQMGQGTYTSTVLLAIYSHGVHAKKVECRHSIFMARTRGLMPQMIDLGLGDISIFLFIAIFSIAIIVSKVET